MKLLTVRRRRGLTQQEVARLARMPSSTYAAYENGQIENPPLKVWRRIAKALDVSVLDLEPTTRSRP
jgi:transcriptional regulator with XRE-family HTH domain